MNKKEKDEFFKRLCEVLDEETQGWWAKRVKISQGTISNCYRQRFTSADKIFKILREKQISANWQFFNIGPKSLKLLNADEIDRVQDGFRDAQNKITALERENIRIRKELVLAKANTEQQSLALPKNPGAAGYIDTIAYLRMVIDLMFRMALTYAEQNVDDNKFVEILNWLKKNHEIKKHNTASMLEELSMFFGDNEK